MDAASMITLAVAIIQDESFTREQLLGFLNTGFGLVASSVYIPDLVTTGTVTCETGLNTVDMPDDYGYKLYSAGIPGTSMSSGKLKIRKELSTFRDKYALHLLEGQTGEIFSVCPTGKKLWYVNSPDEDTDVSITYQAEPADLEDLDTSTPACIQSFLHHDLFVNYIASRAYDIIEDGVSDRKDNTQHYQRLFYSAIAILAGLNGPGIDTPDLVREEHEYNTYL